MREKDGVPRRERQGDERRRIGLAEGRERASPAAPVESATGTADFAAGVQVTDAERVWIRANLGPFQKKELILDVLQRVKAGKEATVYLCSAHPSTGRELVAAKVYRERSLRSSRNQGHYQQGRGMLDEDGQSSWRTDKAGSQKSKRGKAATQTSWIMHEFTLLQTLHAQGADVPEPIEHGEQALLMEFIGDGRDAAPTLNDVEIESSDAQRLFERVIFNVELLLGLGWVHGDLSPYNLLYHQGRLVLIDFPQVVDCQNNPRARGIFERDIERVAQYFDRVGWSVDARRLASELWSKHVPEAEFAAAGEDPNDRD
ncbi:MAG: RIO1 family regulatory kinase/ATPase [Deltaproteobacteria bacterium]